MIKHLFKNICINCITLADPLFVQLKTCWAFAIKTPGGIDTVVAASTFLVPFTFIYVCVEKNIMKKSINGENNCQTKQNKKKINNNNNINNNDDNNDKKKQNKIRKRALASK